MSKHTYADSTLKSWTKDELIHQIRVLEHNIAVKQELVNNQAKLLKAWAPVVHSKWEICCDGYYPYCLNCRAEPPGREMTKYCPNCGAKMDGEELQNNE